MLLAKQTNRPVSEVLKIEDGYVAFCVDEVGEYAYGKLKAGKRPIKRGNNQEIAKLLMK